MLVVLLPPPLGAYAVLSMRHSLDSREFRIQRYVSRLLMLLLPKPWMDIPFRDPWEYECLHARRALLNQLCSRIM